VLPCQLFQPLELLKELQYPQFAMEKVILEHLVASHHVVVNRELDHPSQ